MKTMMRYLIAFIVLCASTFGKNMWGNYLKEKGVSSFTFDRMNISLWTCFFLA